jgi:SNF2 family DNA or RNA helicase
LDFTEEERSIYTSYEKGNKSKYSEFLIKLCCHCELDENTKKLIKKCKTLNEIKDELLKYNKQELTKLNKHKFELEVYLNECNDCLLILEECYENDNYQYQTNEEILEEIEIQKNNISTSKRQITNLNKTIDSVSRTYNFLKNSIESSDIETCTICLEQINQNEKTITKCGHKFCWECINGLFNINNTHSNYRKCPNCNTQLLSNDIYLYSSNEIINDINNKELDEIVRKVKSTKIGNIIYFLKNLFESNDKNDKIIIFSQWDILLEKVANILLQYDLKIINCKGTVYQKQRAIREFTKSKDHNIIMLSSRNAASGINLMSANKIILLEPIYGNKEYRTNIENQAIGRSDRIGQNKPIDVYKFIIKDTIEEDILNNNIKEDEIPHITF